MNGNTSSRLLPLVLASVAACFLASCAPTPFLPTPEGTLPEVIRVRNTGTFDLTVDPRGDTRDVYFVFSNPSLYADSTGRPDVSGTVRVDGKTLASLSPQPLFTGNIAPSSPGLRRIEEARRTLRATPASKTSDQAVRSSVSGRPAGVSYDTVGGSSESPIYDGVSDTDVDATCRYVSPSPVQTKNGPRTLNIWVADDCWYENTTSTVPNKIDENMVEELAERFLNAGAGATEDDDIYDWVTGILGPEWGDTGDPDFIGPDGEITILLCDIENDGPESMPDLGGIVGYFDPSNQLTSDAYEYMKSVYPTYYPGSSNGRVMFVLDAVMFGSKLKQDGTMADSWSETGYWADVVFSTLAHEFQHMVHFYRKIFTEDAGGPSDTWIDEMCAQLMEDLVAEKLQSWGPRNVDPDIGGAGNPGNRGERLSLFDKWTYGAFPVDWGTNYGTDSTANYSIAYAFGAWLVRNYGGANLLRDIVASTYTGPDAVTEAVRKAGGPGTMDELIARWAVAVIASNRSDMPPGYRYGRGGWFDSSFGGITYRLGSINLFNYVYSLDGEWKSGPRMFSGNGPFPENSNAVSVFSNIYYEAAENLSVKRTFTVTVPEGIELSVYTRPSF